MSRNTLQKEIICSIVKNMRTHPSPDEVYKEVNRQHPTISRATVYRVLNKLADKGEILKVKMPGTADRFDFNTEDHIHAFCTECGGVFDADINNVKELLKHLDDHIDPKDFNMSSINISIEGICPNCKGHNN